MFAEISDLEKLVEENPSSNFFIDEAPVSEENFTTERLAQISKTISKNNYLWIACLSDKPPHKHDSNLAGNIMCKPKLIWLITYYYLIGYILFAT